MKAEKKLQRYSMKVIEATSKLQTLVEKIDGMIWKETTIPSVPKRRGRPRKTEY